MKNMTKIEVPIVAMAVLYMEDDLHSDTIAVRIVNSGLTELGYRGNTPERTVNSMLRNSKLYSKYFNSGSYLSCFKLSPRYDVLEIPEVRLALYALKKQAPLYELELGQMVEFTFIGETLCAVRNASTSLAVSNPKICTVQVPQTVCCEEILEIMSS
jgi:hypothetical protein